MTYHDNNPFPHPESPCRLHKLIDYFKNHPDFLINPSLEVISSFPECEDWPILLVHSLEYLNQIKSIFNHNPQKDFFWYFDTYIMRNTLQTALIAIQSLLYTCDKIIEGQFRNGFALIRPPGHHSSENSQNGFCVFNNVAIVARYLQKKHFLKKILIFDNEMSD